MATNSLQKYIDINAQLVKALDELLAMGNWQASAFLKTTGKRIQTLREQAQQLLLTMAQDGQAALLQEMTAKAEHIKVFVSLYQTEGHNLKQWHNTLQCLNEHGMTRPIYRDEQQIQSLLRSKTEPQRHAYIGVFVREADIIENNSLATDRLGHTVLTLKMDAIKIENIVEFIHCQKYYRFTPEELVLKDIS